MEYSGYPRPDFLQNLMNQQCPATGPSHWTQECRKRVEAFEAAQQKARQWETYFANFVYTQQQQCMNAEQLDEFRRYLNDYKICWTSCQALDPRAMLAMFREMECSLMQARDEFSAVLTKWKNDQALAQIGKPSNGHELQPISMKCGKLDNTSCDAVGLIRRFQRFVEERLLQSHLTEMGQFWQGTALECVNLASRILEFRRELQRESLLVFEQPPYIVRRFAGKTNSAKSEAGDENGSGPGSDDDLDHALDDGQSECKLPRQASKAKKDTNNNSGDQQRKTSSAKVENKKEHKVVFDLRVRLMIGDKSRIGDATKVHAILLTDQQCKELLNRKLTAYDDPLTALSEIGPPVTNKRKRPTATVRRRTPNIPGIPPFAAGQLTPYDACLTYDSTLEHFEAFFQNMKVNEKDRNPESDAQARFYRILFVTKLMDWESKPFYLWCLSLPFPIVVNATRQERATSAKIFCHLALTAAIESVESNGLIQSQSSRIQSPILTPSMPAHCPSTGTVSGDHKYMAWTDFFDRLNWWWLKQTGAQLGLDTHEAYLAWKLGVTLGNPGNDHLALEQKYDGLEFSFWDWLFLISDYVKRNKHYWDSGFILGFVSKDQVNSYLARSKEPVMFIRFSDSILGSLVISYGVAGKEPQHIILNQRDELKQHSLSFFIQQSKQLLNVNYISTDLNPSNGLKQKWEFFKLEEIKISSNDDDADAMTKRGYTKPRLAFDWSEPPSMRDQDHDDESTCSSMNLEEILQSELCLGKEFTYDDLAADPNGFSTALVPNPSMANSPPQPGTNGNAPWSGFYNCNDAFSIASPPGTVPNAFQTM